LKLIKKASQVEKDEEGESAKEQTDKAKPAGSTKTARIRTRRRMTKMRRRRRATLMMLMISLTPSQ